MDFFNNWFMNAHSILSHSGGENGAIPLSELECYMNNFGLIGTFSEFVSIIYAISDSCLKHKMEKSENKD